MENGKCEMNIIFNIVGRQMRNTEFQKGKSRIRVPLPFDWDREQEETRWQY